MTSDFTCRAPSIPSQFGWAGASARILALVTFLASSALAEDRSPTLQLPGDESGILLLQEKARQVLATAADIHQKTLEAYEQAKAMSDQVDFERKLQAGNVKYDEPGVGNGKFSLHNGVPICRVYLEDENLTLFYVERELIDGPTKEQRRTRKALGKHVDRQNMFRGRDVVIVIEDDGKQSLELEPHPQKRTWTYWKKMARAAGLPDSGDVLNTAFWVPFQIGLTLSIGAVAWSQETGGPLMDGILYTASANSFAHLYNAGFSSWVGIFMAWYKHLMDEGSQTRRRVNSILFSLAYTVPFVIGMNIEKELLPIGPDGISVAATYLWVTSLGTVVFGAYNKDDVFQVFRAKDDLRHFEGTYKVLGIDTKIRKGRFLRNLLYNAVRLPPKLLVLAGVNGGGLIYYGGPIGWRYYNHRKLNQMYAGIKNDFDQDPSLDNVFAMERLQRRREEVERAWHSVVSVFTTIGAPLSLIPGFESKTLQTLEGRVRKLEARKVLNGLRRLRQSLLISSPNGADPSVETAGLGKLNRWISQLGAGPGMRGALRRFMSGRVPPAISLSEEERAQTLSVLANIHYDLEEPGASGEELMQVINEALTPLGARVFGTTQDHLTDLNIDSAKRLLSDVYFSQNRVRQWLKTLGEMDLERLRKSVPGFAFRNRSRATEDPSERSEEQEEVRRSGARVKTAEGQQGCLEYFEALEASDEAYPMNLQRAH